MKKFIAVLVALALVTYGCLKNKQEAARPTGTNTSLVAEHDAPSSFKSAKTEVAKGELRKILLALRRVHFP